MEPGQEHGERRTLPKGAGSLAATRDLDELLMLTTGNNEADSR